MSDLIIETDAISIRHLKKSFYVVFNCPACGSRNNQSEHQANDQTSDCKEIVFRCSRCYRQVHVRKPIRERITL